MKNKTVWMVVGVLCVIGLAMVLAGLSSGGVNGAGLAVAGVTMCIGAVGGGSGGLLRGFLVMPLGFLFGTIILVGILGEFAGISIEMVFGLILVFFVGLWFFGAVTGVVIEVSSKNITEELLGSIVGAVVGGVGGAVVGDVFGFIGGFFGGIIVGFFVGITFNDSKGGTVGGLVGVFVCLFLVIPSIFFNARIELILGMSLGLVVGPIVGAWSDWKKKLTDKDFEKSKDNIIEEKDKALDELTQLKGIGPSKAENLYDNGFRSLKDLRNTSKEELQNIKGIGPTLSDRVLDSLEKFDEEGEKKRCLHCGTRNVPEAAYCKYCGTELNDENTTRTVEGDKEDNETGTKVWGDKDQ